MAQQAPHDLLDFDRLRSTPVEPVPFPYLIVPSFIREGVRPAIETDFPEIEQTGSFPLASLDCGPAFANLVDALCSAEMTQIIGEKFGLDLTSHPTMATVRGQCDERDGHIHTDSKSKLITMLLYMNDRWGAEKGRLRILRSPSDLNDVVAEVPPDQATLLVFRNGPNAWHGFETFVGPRRVVQINWVTDAGVARREQARHRFSAFLKRLVSKSGRDAVAH